MSDDRIVTRLLRRQVKTCFPNDDYDDRVKQFISMINEAYQHNDSTRDLLERSMDISTRELRKKNEDLRKSNETLDDFNHSVSHDLKTHAINVISLVKMLKKYLALDNVEKVHDIVGKLELTGNQFIKIIHGFLEISKIEHLLEPNPENIPLDSFFDELHIEFKEVLERSNGQLLFSHEGVDQIFLSSAHLTVILRNLISNGLKYSKSDRPPIVNVRVVDYEIYIKIEVEDNGVGIDMQKNRLKLFTMFSRLENHYNIEGTGIGLFLVKRLVEKNNGTIEIESELDIGTRAILKFKKKI